MSLPASMRAMPPPMVAATPDASGCSPASVSATTMSSGPADPGEDIIMGNTQLPSIQSLLPTVTEAGGLYLDRNGVSRPSPGQ